VVSAGLIFLWSFFSPFIQIDIWELHFEDVAGPRTYWSFKVTYEIRGINVGIQEHEYWFASSWGVANEETIGNPLGNWIGSLFMLMFELQIATMACALLSIFKPKPVILSFCLTLNTLVVVCMSRVPSLLSKGATVSYELGYWLAFPSAAFFALALAILIIHKH